MSARNISFKFLLSVALLFIFVQVNGQKFTVGARAGVLASIGAFADSDDRDNFTHSWKPGYFVEGLVNLPLKKSFSWQTEFGYSQRGRIIKFNDDTWNNTATYHYLDASMMLRKSYPLKWAENIRGTWFFNIGPRVSYWLGGKGTVTSGGTYVDSVTGATVKSVGGAYDYKIKFEEAPVEPGSPDFDVMYMDEVNRWLFGLDFGIGVDAPTTSLQRFAFELRFTSGHTFWGTRNSAFNRTLGFTDNLRANEKIISISVDYTLNKDLRDSKKGKSIKSKDLMKSKSKPRRNFDSLIK